MAVILVSKMMHFEEEKGVLMYLFTILELGHSTKKGRKRGRT